MGFAARMQKVAKKLLTKFDESDGRIQLLNKGAPTWDESLGEYVPGVDELINLVGVTVPFNLALVDGTTIQAGDVQVIVTSDTQISIDDKLIIDGVQYSIVREPLAQYTGVAIVYKAQCRR